MAQLISGGPSTMAAYLFGENHPNVQNYLETAYQQAQESITDNGQAMIQAGRQLAERTINTGAFRLARAALRKVGSLGVQDTIQPIETIGALQHAPTAMIPVIMSHPEIKSRYLMGRCEGYGDEWVNPTGSAVAGDDPLYRAVMHTAVIEPDSEYAKYDPILAEETNWGAWQYWDDASEDIGLTENNRLDSQITYDALWLAVKGIDDPTSRWNASL